MAGTRTPTPDWRQGALIVVVLMAMVVSIRGQVAAIEHQLGVGIAILFALTNDVGAILALEAALSAARGSAIRKWAWVAIGLSAGTGAALNWLHAGADPGAAAEALPSGYRVLVGVEPIALILVLSHLVGLVVAERRAAGPTGRAEASRAAETSRSATGDREPPAHRPRDTTASSTPQTASSTASLVATTGGPDRESRAPHRELAPARSTSARPAGHDPRAGSPPRLRVAPAPDPQRPAWMSADLIEAVVASALAAGAPGKRYGEGRVITDHSPLPDGTPMTSHKAKAVLRYIADHDLLRAAS